MRKLASTSLMKSRALMMKTKRRMKTRLFHFGHATHGADSAYPAVFASARVAAAVNARK